MLSFSFRVWIWGLTSCRRLSTRSLMQMGPQGGPGGQFVTLSEHCCFLLLEGGYAPKMTSHLPQWHSVSLLQVREQELVWCSNFCIDILYLLDSDSCKVYLIIIFTKIFWTPFMFSFLCSIKKHIVCTITLDMNPCWKECTGQCKFSSHSPESSSSLSLSLSFFPSFASFCNTPQGGRSKTFHCLRPHLFLSLIKCWNC